jgi:hypothetical protein
MSTSHNIWYTILVIYIEQQFLFVIFFSFSASKNGSNQSKQRSRYCGKCQCFVRCRLRLSRTNNRHLSWAWYKSVIVFLMITTPQQSLKCGLHKKLFIMNSPLVSCPFPVIPFGWMQQLTHPKVMTGNGQLTRGTFIINDFLRNPHFSSDIYVPRCWVDMSQLPDFSLFWN